MIQIFAVGYAVICGGVIVFQVCLLFGAPWGEFTQGGANPGVLPVAHRVGAGVSVLLLLFMALVTLSVGGVLSDWLGWPRWLGWIVLGVQVLSTVMNWITPSRLERLVWGPVTTFMLVLIAGVMLL